MTLSAHCLRSARSVTARYSTM